MDVYQAVLKLAESWQREIVTQADVGLGRSRLRTIVFDLVAVVISLYWCEQRRLIPPGQLQSLQGSPTAYQNLSTLWQQFCRQLSYAWLAPVTIQLTLPDGLVQSMVKSLYYPDLHQFSALPIEALGYLYEQSFTLFEVNDWGERDGHLRYVNLKKTGGIYYTPQAIVNYMVEDTINRYFDLRLQQGLPFGLPNVLDLTCGGGIFLLTAYQALLDRQLQHHLASGNFTSSILQRDPNQQWQLSFEQRCLVLRSIHGVDLDPGAVAVTQLSLGLKLLETQRYSDLLPPLPSSLKNIYQNIHCGNALTRVDLPHQLQPIHASEFSLNWQAVFPNVFSDILPVHTISNDSGNNFNNGFDIVIGNPPYVDAEQMSVSVPHWRTYGTTHYQVATGNWDLFCVCIEQALRLCRGGGITSLVVPNKLLSADYARSVRQLLMQASQVISIRDYSRAAVFEASVYPVVYIAQKHIAQKYIAQTYNQKASQIACPSVDQTITSPTFAATSQTLYEQMQTIEQVKDRYFVQLYDLQGDPPAELTQPWLLSPRSQVEVMQRLERWPRLGEIVQVVGAATVAEAYGLKPFVQEGAAPSPTDFRLVNSGTIDRYCTLWGQKSLRYLGQVYQYPIVSAAHLHQISAKRLFQAKQAKILIAGMTQRLECALDLTGVFLAGKSTSLILLQPNGIALDWRYLLGLLNSRLLSFYIRTRFTGNQLQGGYFRIGPPQLRQLPIVLPHSSAVAASLCNQLIELVDPLLNLHALPVPEPQRTCLHSTLQSLDPSIDALVYELYGLEDWEIQRMAEV